ncbi:MAG: gamma-glutamyl-gamma-aminobutyrate hydrolase family protein [Candidatus Hydrogenedentes bacterium]|nr:gamma-glutamyl-gamma-aminobutyrate hydrolase family protein [Candidatus Hydrogenedentota bacterium]
MKPVIGITSDLIVETNQGREWNSNRLLTSYCDAVVKAGGVPVILPLASDSLCKTLLGRIDGIILSGGNDIPPEVLGEPSHPAVEALPMARWDSERLWLETASEMEKPVLGVCLGMQVMNVAAGGKMIQDIPDQRPGSLIHGTPSRLHRHDVSIEPGSKLATLAPGSRVEITSSHHQGIRDVPPLYRLAATSEDGLVEAIEHPDKEFQIGVQWHPERDPHQPDWLLQAVVRHCGNVSTFSKAPQPVP